MQEGLTHGLVLDDVVLCDDGAGRITRTIRGSSHVVGGKECRPYSGGYHTHIIDQIDVVQ